MGNRRRAEPTGAPDYPSLPFWSVVTDVVMKGAMNEVTYQTTLRLRETPPGGNINMSTYIVWYRD